MHQTWQSSLEDNFVRIYEEAQRNYCINECTGQCTNIANKKQAKKALQYAINMCMEITSDDPAKSQAYCQTLAKKYLDKIEKHYPD